MNQGIKCPSQMSALLVGCSTAPHRWEQTRHREGVCLCWLFVGWMPVLAISRAVALSCHLFVLSHPAFPQTKNTFECLRGPEEESARKNKESNSTTCTSPNYSLRSHKPLHAAMVLWTSVILVLALVLATSTPRVSAVSEGKKKHQYMCACVYVYVCVCVCMCVCVYV